MSENNKLTFLGIEKSEEVKPDYNYDYKLKHSIKAINVEDKKAFNELLDETDKLRNNEKRNEKISVTFRLVVSKNNHTVIHDRTPRFDYAYEKLIDSSNIEDLVKDYKKYVYDLYNDKNSHLSKDLKKEHGHVELKDLRFEVLKTYFPMDVTNKKEEIPNIGHFVQYFKNVENSIIKTLNHTVDCSTEDKGPPDFNQVSFTKNSVQNIREIRMHKDGEEVIIRSKNKKDLH